MRNIPLHQPTELSPYMHTLHMVRFAKHNIVIISLTQNILPPREGGVLPQILDRGVPRRFLNPNPI